MSLGEVLAVVLFRIEAEVWVRTGAIPVLEWNHVTCSWHGSGLNNVCASHVYPSSSALMIQDVLFLSPRPFYSEYTNNHMLRLQTGHGRETGRMYGVRTPSFAFQNTPDAVWYVLTVALLLGLIADYHLPYQRHRNYFPYLHTNHGNTCRKECWSMLSAFCHA